MIGSQQSGLLGFWAGSISNGDNTSGVTADRPDPGVEDAKA